MKELNFLGLLIFIFLMSSCDRRDELTEISGNINVKDFYSDKPVSQFQIGLTEHKVFSFFTPEIVIDTFECNVGGEFEFSFENKSSYINNLIYVGNDTYADFEEILLQKDKTNDIDIRVKPFNKLLIKLLKTDESYDNILIEDQSQNNLIYDSIYSNLNIDYLKSIPEEYMKLSFRLYNEKTWENYKHIDTTIYISNIYLEEFEFKY